MNCSEVAELVDRQECSILRVRSSWEGTPFLKRKKAARVIVEPGELGRQLTERLTELIPAGSFERQLRELIGLAENLLAEGRTAGLVLLLLCIDNGVPLSGSLTAPAAFPVPFEPTPLTDTNDQLATLWRQSAGSEPHGRLSTLRRWSRACFETLFHLSASACFVGLPLAAWLLIGRRKDLAMACLGLGFLSLMEWLNLKPAMLAWNVMPGGVLLRRWGSRRVVTCTRRDTVLLLTPRGRRCRVSLRRGRKPIASRSLTEFETLCLLAAWQAAPVELSEGCDW